MASENNSKYNEDTIIIAFDVSGSDREAMMRHVHKVVQGLFRKSSTRYAKDGSAVLEAFWIAEDDRCDGSDNDSAVFVPFFYDGSAMSQEKATQLLHREYCKRQAAKKSGK